jgi:hypothetical protein
MNPEARDWLSASIEKDARRGWAIFDERFEFFHGA